MKIGTIERAIFPGGKAVLVARGEDNQFLVGLVCKPKTAAWRWARRATTKAERRRLQEAVDEEYPE